jgi:glutamyl-tRNA(Gln) amidotransferase subunit D
MLTEDYRKREEGKLELMDKFEEKVALLKFYPGFQNNIIDFYVKEGFKGLIFEGTGLGHVSTRLYDTVESAINEGLFLGMTSQCIWGRLDMDVYTTGRELQRLGVESLGDMLPETAYVKLSWALGNSKKLEDVKKLMNTNIAGEYSNRTLYFG